MKRFLSFITISLCALSTFAIDPSGAKPVSEPSESSGLDILFMIIGGIVLVVIGIPDMFFSLKSDDKDEKKFGCFMLVGFLLLILLLIANCSEQ